MRLLPFCIDRPATSLDLQRSNLQKAMEKSIETFLAQVEQHCHGTTIAESRKTQKQIDACINTLNSLMNRLTPILHLPPELLSKIFYVLRDSCRYSNSKGRKSWMRVAQVCRAWRHIALDDSGLWATIDTEDGYRCASELLKRSRNSLISLTTKSQAFRLTFGPRTPLFSTFRSGSRIETLVFKLGHRHADYSNNNILKKFLSSSGQHLKTLQIHFERLGHVYSRTRKPYFTFPEKPFGGSAPALRRLHLARCKLQSNPTFIRNVVVLGLSSVTFAPSFSMENLLVAFEDMSNLEYLNLQWSLPKTPITWRSRPQTSLQQLKQLSVKDTCLLCSKFISAISVPPSTALIISVCADEAIAEFGYRRQHTARDFSQLISHAQALSPRPLNAQETLSPSPYLTVSIFTPTNARTEIWGWTEDVPPQELSIMARHPKIPRIQIILDDTLTTTSHRDAITAFPLHATKTLRTSSFKFNFKNLWADHFSLLPVVSTLIVANSDEYDLAEILLHDSGMESLRKTKYGFTQAPRSNRQDSRPCVTRFPHLKTLVLDGMDMGGDLPLEDQLSHVLLNAFRMRKKTGSVLTRLELLGCRNVSQTDVDRLRPVVNEILWDGLSLYDEPDLESSVDSDSDSDSSESSTDDSEDGELPSSSSDEQFGPNSSTSDNSY
ncbi:hypothetical protein FA15DRAFT_284203 [Coprinopsis marcescibilis]|uniref:F-box domain-containing protein n=1 Tax=Coprinopsis marcescibilis TaxID=230819 RepID=A0A5C3L9E1_COPMA|nr:hypothetical protein FA15DRAFT_284203 [Coprinopsis marcescibilis]